MFLVRPQLPVTRGSYVDTTWRVPHFSLEEESCPLPRSPCIFPAKQTPSRASSLVWDARRCRRVHYSSNTTTHNTTWRSKAPCSVFSPSLRRRSPSRSRVPRRPRRTCPPPYRGPAPLRRSKLRRHRSKLPRPAEWTRKGTTSLPKGDSTNFLATRPRQSNRGELTASAPGAV